MGEVEEKLGAGKWREKVDEVDVPRRAARLCRRKSRVRKYGVESLRSSELQTQAPV